MVRAARRVMSWPALVALTLVAVWAIERTGGVGGLLTACVGAVFVVVWSAHPPFVIRAKRAERLKAMEQASDRRRRRAWAAAWGVVLAFALWNLASVSWYVTRFNTADPLSQRTATWARNHGYSPVVDWLESIKFDKPPSVAPADELALGAPIMDATTTTIDRPRVDATTTTTTIDPGPLPPAPISPIFEPTLSGEGEWREIARAGGYPAMWVTSLRPYAEAGGVVATVVVIDQTYLRVGLFNGSEEPGGRWARGSKVPEELYGSLVAAMNSGFRFEHIRGGYVTEGKVVKPLKEGDATIAIGRDGKIVLGALGREIHDDGSWLSLRQNLMLMVDGGVSTVGTEATKNVKWGDNWGKTEYVNRSAVCELADGRLAYALVGRVSAEQMAQSLTVVGCVKAVELDINGTWPNFFVFWRDPDGSLVPVLVDSRMGTNTRRYLRGSTKDFFAFFDATMIEGLSVLDA